VKEIEGFKIANSTALATDLKNDENGHSLQEIARQAGRPTVPGMSAGGSGGRHRVGKGGKRLWQLFVVDEFS
jgi:hypothetical protein